MSFTGKTENVLRIERGYTRIEQIYTDIFSGKEIEICTLIILKETDCH